MEQLNNLQIPGANNRPILLDITYIANRTPKPLVIFSHGFKGFKDWGHFNEIARAFVEQQFVFVKFNFSHNGTTPAYPTEFVDLEAFGNNSFSKELDDLGRVIDFVQSRKFPLSSKEYLKKEVYLLGHSRGGGISILKAAEDKRVKKTATWASVSEYGRFWSEDVIREWREKGVIYIPNARTGQQMPLYWQLYEDYQYNAARLSIPAAVKNMRMPLLLVHGTADFTVPYQSALDLCEWQPQAQLKTILGGDHTFGGKHPWEEDALPEETLQAIHETVRFFLVL